MAVRIRLKRMGKIHHAQYRVVVVDGRKKRDGRVIEEIGIYDPNTEPSTIDINSERAQYWLSVGAQPSDRVLEQLKITGDYQAAKGIEGESTLKTVEKIDKAAAREEAVKSVQDSAEKLRAERAEAIAKAEAEAQAAAEAEAAEKAAAEESSEATQESEDA